MSLDNDDLVCIANDAHLFCIEYNNGHIVPVDSVDRGNRLIISTLYGERFEFKADHLTDTGVGILHYSECIDTSKIINGGMTC